jgi:glycosyltransferase involved in cell wall biosynthesis
MLDRGLKPGAATATGATVSIDVVICTYNRAASLDAVLSTLSRQSPNVDVVWSVLVIDNASTDSTGT